MKKFALLFLFLYPTIYVLGQNIMNEPENSTDNFEIFKVEEKEGLRDSQGNEILPAVFYDIEKDRFNENQFNCKISYTKTGLFDAQQKKWILPLIYKRLYYSENYYLIQNNDYRYQLLDKSFKPIIESDFQNIEFEYEDYYKVLNNNLYGIYDIKQKKLIVPIAYNDIDSYGEKYFRIKKNKQYNLFDKTTEKTLFKNWYAKIRGVWFRYSKNDLKYFDVQQGDKRLLIDSLEKTIISVPDFEGHFYCEDKEEPQKFFARDSNYKILFSFDLNGKISNEKSENNDEKKEISRLKPISIDDYRNQKIQPVGNQYVIQFDDGFASEPYDEIKSIYLHNRSYYLYKKDNLYGVMDNSFTIITPPLFEQIIDLNYQVLLFTKGNKIGMYDIRSKKEEFPAEYDAVILEDTYSSSCIRLKGMTKDSYPE